MTVTVVNGDLFLSDAQAIAHGCNCAGKMGSGIALQFRTHFPLMHEEYVSKCFRQELSPGDCFTWIDPEEKYIVFNLMTQEIIGPNAKVPYIRSALNKMLEECKSLGITHVAIPLIGCGIGGLDWETQVYPLVLEIFHNEQNFHLEVVIK